MTETISADYTLRPSELAQALAVLVEARQPVMVWGPPAAARSRIARQVASAASRRYVDVRALLLDPGPPRHPLARRVRSHPLGRALLIGLQYLYANVDFRKRLFALRDEYILPGADKTVGRPGMETWKILVMGVRTQAPMRAPTFVAEARSESRARCT